MGARRRRTARGCFGEVTSTRGARSVFVRQQGSTQRRSCVGCGVCYSCPNGGTPDKRRPNQFPQGLPCGISSAGSGLGRAFRPALRGPEVGRGGAGQKPRNLQIA
jgi:hypothetical protein